MDFLSGLVKFLKSVRFRLTLWYVGLLTVVLTVFSSVVYLLLTNSLYASQDELLKNRLNQLASSYNISDGQLNLQQQDENGPVELVGDEILLLLNKQGVVIQQFGNLSQISLTQLKNLVTSTPAQEFFTDFQLTTKPSTSNTGQSSDYRILVAPVVDNNLIVGTLILGRSQDNTKTIAHSLLMLLLFVTPLTLLISASGGYWLANRAMRPVQTLTHTARNISETDFNRRLNLNRSDELGELAATFDAMLARLQAAFERQRQFTADASHELRTPLTIIRLEAEQGLCSQSSSPSEYKKILSNVKNESDHMTRLVNDLLMLARADTDHIALKYEILDIGEVALEVVERLKPLANRQGVDLKMVEGELPELLVKGDYLYLSQMITNLVENAIKFTAGYISTTTDTFVGLKSNTAISSTSNNNNKWVWVKIAETEKGWANISICDNGPGIATEYISHLFDRFYQVDTARTSYLFDNSSNLASPSLANESLATNISPSSGSGLGLAIVKEIVEMHGGKIEVKSWVAPEKHGSNFNIKLPLSLNN